MASHITIVMAYKDRLPQLLFTLRTISASSFKDIDIVIVDDDSIDRLERHDLDFDFPIDIITIEKKDKWYCNPCIPYNIGFAKAKGDIVVIQNPETCHKGDILRSIIMSLTRANYLNFQIYSANAKSTANLHMINHDNSLFDAISCVLSPMVESCPNWQEHTDGWFNHYVYRPKNYHWISAIHSSNLHKLNGFDERYADGLQFDDDEFLRRIARLGLDIRMVIEPSLFGVHQYHGEQPFPDDDPRIIRNYLLFQSTTHETNYQAIGNKYFNTRE